MIALIQARNRRSLFGQVVSQIELTASEALDGGNALETTDFIFN
jgi:hypothetical protein